MQSLVDVALEVQTFCESQGWRFAIIGGMALQIWGEERLTKDVDLTILTQYVLDEQVIDRLLERFVPRIEAAKEFALVNRVLLLKHSSGIGIDISLGALDFEFGVVSRSKKSDFNGTMLQVCSAEDLVILKTFAARPQDWIDVERVIAKNSLAGLDWDLIEKELTPLLVLKEEPELYAQLLKVKSHVEKTLKVI